MKERATNHFSIKATQMVLPLRIEKSSKSVMVLVYDIITNF